MDKTRNIPPAGLPAMWKTRFDFWVGKISWRKAWQPTPVFLPEESPWTEEPGTLQSMVSQESETSEQLSTGQQIPQAI